MDRQTDRRHVITRPRALHCSASRGKPGSNPNLNPAVLGCYIQAKDGPLTPNPNPNPLDKIMQKQTPEDTSISTHSTYIT